MRLAHFPPRGDRSVPPNALLGKERRISKGMTVYNVWDEHVAVFAQIEDVQGVDNVEEIAQVPGRKLLL